MLHQSISDMNSELNEQLLIFFFVSFELCRIVFSAENQDICSPAYEHFQENLQDLVTVDEGPVKFTAEKLSVAFPQYFQYQRVKELVG